MKIFAVSDMHGNLDGLDPSGNDIVIIAGDFAKMKGWGKWHVNDMKKWIEKKFIPWTSQWPDIEFAVVPGNHDLVFDAKWTLPYADIDFSIDFPGNVHVLIDKEIIVNGLRIYGTPWVPTISGRWAFEADEFKQEDKFSRIPAGLDILVTHTPPRYEHLDESMQYGRPDKFGSYVLAKHIFDKKPKYVFCGHIHSGDHDHVKLGETSVYNVSRVNEDYEIAYKPRIIEI